MMHLKRLEKQEQVKPKISRYWEESKGIETKRNYPYISDQ
jgi:hypothetical protein